MGYGGNYIKSEILKSFRSYYWCDRFRDDIRMYLEYCYGIVTTEHGNVKYLGAVTSGVSTRIWLRNQIYSYSYEGPLKNPDGSDMESNIPKECRDNLVKMALFNIVEKNTDDVAYFQGYYFINRYSVRNAISNIRKNNMQGDALNNVSREIASIVFK